MLSIFSGAGGMDIGLEAAGFASVGEIEIEPNAQRTLAANRPNWQVLANGDVLVASKLLSPKSLGLKFGELELLAGGPPCQPFSLAAQWSTSGRKGMSDDRSNTVHATLDLFESFAPKAMFLENVLGFVQGKNSALAEISSRLEQVAGRLGVGYNLHWRLLNSADYGVPQNRKRVAVVVVRSDLSWEWPTMTHHENPVSAWDAIGDLDEEDLPNAQGSWSALLASIPEGQNYQWLTEKGGGPELFGYRTKYWNFLLKLARDKPAWTLAASPGPSTGPFHWENRPLSIREAMRLQSFPDDWVLTGSYREQLRLVGNATPPLLSQAVGRQLLRSLGVSVSRKPILEAREKVGPIPSAKPPRPIPDRFSGSVGPKSAHGGTGLGPAPLPVADSGQG